MRFCFLFFVSIIMNTWIYMLWMVLCVAVSYSHDSFPCSNFPIFGQWEPLHFESCVLLTELFIFKSVLIFWLSKCLKTIIPYISCPGTLSKLLSRVQLFAIPWTVAKLLGPWNFPGKNVAVGCHFLSRGSSWPRDWKRVSWITGRFFTIWATREVPELGTAISPDSLGSS